MEGRCAIWMTWTYILAPARPGERSPGGSALGLYALEHALLLTGDEQERPRAAAGVLHDMRTVAVEPLE